MGMSKKAVVVLVPSLLFGIGAPAWLGTARQNAPIHAKVMPACQRGNSLLSLIGSILPATETSPRGEGSVQAVATLLAPRRSG
jgi:hypothetical protein